MAKLARDMVKKGDLGKIRKVVVQYPQGWLATALEKTGQMQASWRTDPKQTRHRRLRRRHRHPRRQPGGVHLGPQDHPHLRRADHVRPGPPARRRLQLPAEVRQRRQGRPARQPDRHRRREQPRDLGPRREGQPRMAPGAPELPVHPRDGQAGKGLEARQRLRRRLQRRRRPAAPASPPATRKPSSRPSPTTT